MKKYKYTIINIITSKTSVFVVSALILGLLVWEYLCIHDATKHLHYAIDNLDVVKNFPIKGPDPQSLENSNLHLNFLSSKFSTGSIVIAVLGVLLTYAAFYSQYIFNLRQKIDLTSERFENQYFHFLDVYRDIRNTITVPNAGSGKIAFHYMFYEYKALYNKIKTEGLLAENADAEELNAVAFSIFIDGVSYDFMPTPQGPAIEPARLVAFRDQLLQLQEQSEKHDSHTVEDRGVKYLRDYRARNIKYFDGHRLRLIPYFKYILLIIDHIDHQTSTEIEKLNALRYLSSEMSEHEIGLLIAYTHYAVPGPKYWLYLKKIAEDISDNKKQRFRFDNELFIV